MKRSFVIDIGSSKVSFLDASASDGALVVNRFETCAYSGYRLGRLPDAASLSEAIDTLLARVTPRFELRSRRIFIGVSAPFIRIEVTKQSIPTPFGKVTEDDLDYLLDRGDDAPAVEGCMLMHTTPFDYTLNGIPCGGSPIGLSSTTLSASFCHAYCSERFVSLVTEAVESAGGRVGTFISSPMACASFTIPFNARLGGAVLIDCGGTHCDVSAIRGNAVIRTESFGIGGAHFTSDIAYAFGVSPDIAEELKRSCFFGLDAEGMIAPVRAHTDPRLAVDSDELAFVVEARADEFAEMLAVSLDTVFSELHAGSPVYLVGGGVSNMPGFVDRLLAQTGRSITAIAPRAGRLNGIRHIPPLALAHFMLYDGDMEESGRSVLKAGASRLIGGIKEFFTPGAFARKHKS